MAIRMGLMGCGTVAGYGHLPAIAACSDLHLAALYEPDAARRAVVAAKYPRARVCATVAEFFAQDLAAVAVTSPAPFHRDNVLAAAAAGCHVLCEKPLAMNDRETAEMTAAMQRAGRALITCFVYRFAQPAQAIKAQLAAGAIGTPRALRLIYTWHCHGKSVRDAENRLVPNQRREGRMAEGGPMVDCGTHQIDLARWWLGSEVVAVHGHAAWIDPYHYPDHVWAHLDHANGAHTMVEMSYAYCHTAKEPRYDQFVYELIGTDGVLRYHQESRSLQLRNGQGTTELPFVGDPKDFAATYRAFADFLHTGRIGDLGTAADGLTATRIARAATDQALARRHEGTGVIAERPG